MRDEDFFDIFNEDVKNNEFDIYIFDPNPRSEMLEVVDSRIKKMELDKYVFHIFKCKATDFFKELNQNILKLEEEKATINNLKIFT